MLTRVRRLAALAALAAFAFLVVAGPASAATSNAPTRFSLAGGCFALQSASSPARAAAGAERLRMQATALGSYLLYTPDRKVLAAQPSGAVAPAETPSPAADWRVADAGSGTFTLSPASDSGRVLRVGQDGAVTTADRGAAGAEAQVRFASATGCAVYPEAELGAQGTPSKGTTPYGAVSGFLEAHMHWMTFSYFGGDFHCGRPWHPYGIPYALPDCSEVEGPQGSAAGFQNFLNFGQPAAPHDTSGYPKLTEWRSDNLTYEGMYWKWVQRAWASGLRLMVMGVNENRELCELQPRRRYSCDEMETVRRGFADLRELQRYVDAQAGGPGKGFFQIVTSANEARRVINSGKMAVVLEIEVSELFGCRGWETSTCDAAQVDRALDEFHRLGVRSSLLLNKFDNPLAGVRFDSGPIGVLINGGNKKSSGSFWDARTCTGPYRDNTIESGSPEASAVASAFFPALGLSGAAPTYPPPPHCNKRGLTELGRFTVRRMIEKGMIVNPDHMSQAAVEDTLTVIEATGHSGVISPHGWVDPGNWPRFWKVGGLAFPSSGTSPGYVKDYAKYRPVRTPFMFGWGYGADLGGLASQPEKPGGTPVGYPFRSYDRTVSFDRQRTGERTFDYDKEGVAHYGLYPEWFADVQRRGGPQMGRDMSNAAEAYLQMWERAEGVKGGFCRPALGAITASGFPQLRLGDSWETVLRRAGQPQQRSRAWAWCVNGLRNRTNTDVAEFSPSGRMELVLTTAVGRHAGGIPTGAPASRLGNATSIGGGTHIRRIGRAIHVYSVRSGRVRAVGSATAGLARNRAALRAAMARAAGARASQGPRSFIPNPATANVRATGRALSGMDDPKLNQAIAYLCQIGDMAGARRLAERK